jgi:hypothetical protein
MFGGTDTSLTHVNNRWVFRARPNDSYSSRVIADFGVNTLSIKGYKGLEGTYELDRNGDGLHGYNIVKNEGGRIVFMKRVDFPVQ